MRVIASSNGLEATRLAYQKLQAGADTLDAVVAGMTLVEDDPEETSVGFGGLPNELGIVELDAAVMHGPTHRAGGVAALQRIRNPARVAQVVLRHTDHVLLVGEGALQFARAHGFVEENLLTEKARKIWLYWKQTLSDKDDWLPPAEEPDPAVIEFFNLPKTKRREGEAPAEPRGDAGLPSRGSAGASPSQAADQPAAAFDARHKLHRPAGTVHVSALNDRGEISCGTSTSGLAFKIPGRVGDSPIVGAGLYVDNAVGSCGATGRGEATLKNVTSFAAVELMRSGLSPRDAGRDVLRRVVDHTTEPWLLDDRGRPNFNLTLYLLAKDGRYAGITLRGAKHFSVTDEKGTRLERCETLVEESP